MCPLIYWKLQYYKFFFSDWPKYNGALLLPSIQLLAVIATKILVSGHFSTFSPHSPHLAVAFDLYFATPRTLLSITSVHESCRILALDTCPTDMFMQIPSRTWPSHFVRHRKVTSICMKFMPTMYTRLPLRQRHWIVWNRRLRISVRACNNEFYVIFNALH